MIRAHVNVTLKEDVMDPQGNAVGQALSSLGHPGVKKVRVGRCFDLLLDGDDPAAAQDQVKRMCEQLLANTVIERFDIRVEKA
jgi:phosphoribosylformylglycinamidine synthase subunit PurS